MSQYRQGDLLFDTMGDAVALSGTPRPDGVIARGEATGHAHRFEDLTAGAVFERAGRLYVKVVAESARIVHEEHGPINLPKGVYRVVRQREFDSGWERTVRD